MRILIKLLRRKNEIPMNIRGVIFDFNGTLFWDTDKQENAWREFAKSLSGREITDDEFKNHFHGKTNKDIIEYLTEEIPDNETLYKLTQEKESLYRKLCKQDIENFKLAPGAIKLLDFLKEENIPITIATASEITNVRFFIEEFNLENWFDTSKIVFDDSSFRGKPEPDIYLKAAQIINVPVEQCLVFEDAVSGITSAHRANIGKIIAIAPMEEHNDINKVEGVAEVIPNFYNVKKYYFNST